MTTALTKFDNNSLILLQASMDVQLSSRIEAGHIYSTFR